jgi:lysophospholipase L1-like esterase
MPSFSTSSTIGAIDRNLPGLRRLRRDLADTATGSGTPTDVVVIGDSITRGFNAGADKSWTRVFRAELKRLYGFPAGGIGHRISNSNEYEPTTFAYAGTAANVTGIGPGGLATNLPYSAVQANSAAIAITADRYLIHYLPQNTFGASRLSIVDSVAGSLGGGLATFDGSLPAFGSRSAVYNTGALGASVARTVTLATFTDASFTTGLNVAGCYVLSGEGAGDLRVWNMGRFGAFTSSFLTSRSWTDLGAALGAAGVIIATGTNDGASTYAGSLRSVVAQVVAQYAAVSALAPSIVIVPPPANGLRSASDGAAMRLAAYAVASEYGAAVFDWQTVFGVTSGGDPLSLTTDGTHPNNRGHRMIGEALARFVFSGGLT